MGLIGLAVLVHRRPKPTVYPPLKEGNTKKGLEGTDLALPINPLSLMTTSDKSSQTSILQNSRKQPFSPQFLFFLRFLVDMYLTLVFQNFLQAVINYGASWYVITSISNYWICFNWTHARCLMLELLEYVTPLKCLNRWLCKNFTSLSIDVNDQIDSKLSNRWIIDNLTFAWGTDHMSNVW